MESPASRRDRRRWLRPRWTDVLALIGVSVFTAQAVDRYTTGQPADPTLTFASLLLATGAVGVPRVREYLLARLGAAPPSPPRDGGDG